MAGNIDLIMESSHTTQLIDQHQAKPASVEANDVESYSSSTYAPYEALSARPCSYNARERSLISALAMLIFLFLAVVAGILTMWILGVGRKPICQSPECVRTAGFILNSIDLQADPCDDFYEFACGRWMRERHIPDYKQTVSNFDDLASKVDRSLRGGLRERHIPDYKQTVSNFDDLASKVDRSLRGGLRVRHIPDYKQTVSNFDDLASKVDRSLRGGLRERHIPDYKQTVSNFDDLASKVDRSLRGGLRVRHIPDYKQTVSNFDDLASKVDRSLRGGLRERHIPDYKQTVSNFDDLASKVDRSLRGGLKERHIPDYKQTVSNFDDLASKVDRSLRGGLKERHIPDYKQTVSNFDDLASKVDRSLRGGLKERHIPDYKQTVSNFDDLASKVDRSLRGGLKERHIPDYKQTVSNFDDLASKVDRSLRGGLRERHIPDYKQTVSNFDDLASKVDRSLRGGLRERHIPDYKQTVSNFDDLASKVDRSLRGGLRERHIPDYKQTVSNFDDLASKVDRSLRDELESSPTAQDTNATLTAKSFYQLCVNDTEIGEDYATVLADVTEHLGGWPVVLDAQNGTTEWELPAGMSLEDVYAYLVRHFSAEYIFKFTVAPDDRNSSQHVILIENPVPAFRHIFRYEQEALDAFNSFVPERKHYAYRSLIESCLKAVGADNSSVVFDVATQISVMEEEITQAVPFDYDRSDISALYKKVTLDHLSRTFPQFDWKRFIRAVFPSDYVDDNTLIVVNCWDYLEAFDRMWPEMKGNTTNVVNFLLWRWFLKDMLPELPMPFRMSFTKFRAVFTGAVPLPRPKWRQCVEVTNELLNMATGRLYIVKKFDHEAKADANEMIERIIDAFRLILTQEQWLSEDTRKRATNKVNSIVRKIGYPAMLETPAEVDKMYEEYQIATGSYYHSKFRFMRLHTETTFKLLKEKVDRHKWVTGPATVNAFYSPNHNTIIFPAGIMQPVFYSPDFPKSLNYGGIGVVIGHEITHGFDDKGRLYDENGNMIEWWDELTIEQFENKTDCIEKQYSGFVLKQVNRTANGVRTKGENIADNGGLKEAFMAYKSWEREHGREPLLPGLDLTHDQLFFLNYAQIWCGKMGDHEIIMKLNESVHSPGPIRVQGPLSNSREFAKAYNCPAGSNMNPIHKCHIW